MKIEFFKQAIKTSQIRITDHAFEESNDDKLEIKDILYSVVNGEIIENYPTDKPYPSCLILGYSTKKEPIHTVWAFNKMNEWAVLITVYRPDPDRWIDWKIRRKNQ